MPQTILVLDFGSQYTQVIARRIREQKVYSQVLPFDTPLAAIKKAQPLGIILSGGPASVLSKGAPLPDKRIFSLGVPVLGICYGLQLMGKLLGGEVKKCEHREYGRSRLTIKKSGKLFAKMPKSLTVWNSHGDAIVRVPQGFQGIASTENSDFSAIEDSKRRFYGLQFHPEVEHSQRGVEVIKNFLFSICKCKADWDMGDFIEASVQKIRDQVGKKKVILGLSGGVDSSVAAALIDRAIGKQLTSIFVDNGLLRLNEREEVIKLFNDHIPGKLRVAKAGNLFLGKLKGVTDPERKRKIIGKTFIDVFDKEVKKLGEVDFLAQGTLYPDVIESVPIGGNPAALIKSHHNVGGLPAKMKLKLLEPLRELFKDEVRLLGKKLGLPDHVIRTGLGSPRHR
jgi:GMP synthase (glutamine-hydrolysing)